MSKRNQLTFILLEKLHQDLELLDESLGQDRRVGTLHVLRCTNRRSLLLREQPVLLRLRPVRLLGLISVERILIKGVALKHPRICLLVQIQQETQMHLNERVELRGALLAQLLGELQVQLGLVENTIRLLEHRSPRINDFSIQSLFGRLSSHFVSYGSEHFEPVAVRVLRNGTFEPIESKSTTINKQKYSSLQISPRIRKDSLHQPTPAGRQSAWKIRAP